MKKMLNSAHRAFNRLSESLYEANQIGREVSRLTHLSDGELRRMGLQRGDIVNHVVRTRAYI